MAQLEAMKRYVKNNSHSEQTVEQLLRGEDSSWAQNTSPTFAKNHDQEEQDHPGKKSVLTKVKEKAKKLRHSLSKKKRDDNATPTWGVSLDEDDYDDDEAEDSEYYGAPMYESEKAPDDVKETARQHPRDDVVISEKHVLPNSNSVSPRQQQEEISSKKSTEPLTDKRPEAITDKRPEAIITSKRTAKPEQEKMSSPEAKNSSRPISESLAPLEAMTTSKTLTQTVTDTLGPAYARASEATHMITSRIQDMAIATSAAISPTKAEAGNSDQQKWDKGVSVKEYLIQKFEPGEDEKALSQVISEAISPTKKPGDKTVVEKVRGVVSSLLASSESSSPMATKKPANVPISRTATIPLSKSANVPVSRNATVSVSMRANIPASRSVNTTNSIPISTNAHEVVEEKTEGRILQTN